MNGNAAAAAIVLVMMVTFAFWDQGGWYRVDCALGVARACALIHAEYAEDPRP